MSKLGKATVGLMVVTLLSKILGFGRELVLGSFYGASMYSDAYIVAMNIPGTVFAAIGTALATTFIPLYYENNSIGGKEAANKFSNNIFNIVCILSILLSIIALIFIEPLVKLFAIGFEGETLKLTIDFTKIMIFSMIFIGTSSMLTSILQINGNFIIPGLVGIPYNIVIIISIILSAKINPIMLPIGGLIAILSQFIFQVPFVYKTGYRYKFNLNIKDENIKKIIWLVGPVFIGVAAYNINTMLDRTLASTLSEGTISALMYANRLNLFVIGLFITTLGSVIYPMLSKVSSNNDKQEFIKIISSSINSVIIIVIPISIGAIVLAYPIIKLLFQRGLFDDRATTMTAISLIFYSIGMVGVGLRDILGKVFYSLQDTKTPMINAAIALVINMVLNVILIKYMDYAGLALATSISTIIGIFLLFRSLQKKIGYFGKDNIIKTTIKSLIAAACMGIVTLFVYKFIIRLLDKGFIYDAISLFSAISIGAIVYGILVVLLKIDEVEIITNIIKRKLNK